MLSNQRRSLNSAALLLAAASLLPTWAQAQFRVEISGVGATQIPVAIAKFRDEARSPQAIASIIRADLERSGLFKPVDGSADKLDETARPALPDWRAKGVDGLLAGSVTPLADGRYDVRYRIWDALKAKDLGGQSLVVPAADLRLAAHRIADDIYEKFTGDKGAFATRIAYVSKGGPKKYTLLVADADGEGAQSALTSAQPIISPAWAPDGRRLAYVSFEGGKAVVVTQDVSTGKRTLVASFKGSNSAPAWSPDGKQLIVTLSRDGLSQLYVMGADGEGVRRLTSSSSIDTEAVWSSDGATVYFVSDRGGSPQIYKVPVSGGTPSRVTFNGSYNISPSLSPDGKWLTYIGQVGGAFRVHLMDLSSGDVKPLTDTNHDESPSFAPNSRLIVYATQAKGRDVLTTTSLDGRIKAILSTPQADVREPVWGPDQATRK